MARAPTVAPTAMKATWHSETWPAQPVITTTDTTTSEKMKITEILSESSVSTQCGSKSSTAARSTKPAAARRAHLREPAQLARHRTDLVGGGPRRRRVGLVAADVPLLEEQRAPPPRGR